MRILLPLHHAYSNKLRNTTDFFPKPILHLADTNPLSNSYESLPPNFSLVQNMAAGAFAGIAVRPSTPSRLRMAKQWPWPSLSLGIRS